MAYGAYGTWHIASTMLHYNLILLELELKADLGNQKRQDQTPKTHLRHQNFCVCVLKNKTQKWFLTFLIAKIQLISYKR